MVREAHLVGHAPSYNSFTCLARIVELVANKPFDDVLAERIFRPAAMTSATGETGEQLSSASTIVSQRRAGATRRTRRNEA